MEIDVGDRVLRQNHEKCGTRKLRNYWQEVVYKVVAKDPDLPVFTIRPEDGCRPEGKYVRL